MIFFGRMALAIPSLTVQCSIQIIEATRVLSAQPARLEGQDCRDPSDGVGQRSSHSTIHAGWRAQDFPRLKMRQSLRDKQPACDLRQASLTSLIKNVLWAWALNRSLRSVVCCAMNGTIRVPAKREKREIEAKDLLKTVL